eukprot:scaffold4501_cov320-Pinguiococcus_pyrenoidosus.AAC.9
MRRRCARAIALCISLTILLVERRTLACLLLFSFMPVALPKLLLQNLDAPSQSPPPLGFSPCGLGSRLSSSFGCTEYPGYSNVHLPPPRRPTLPAPAGCASEEVRPCRRRCRSSIFCPRRWPVHPAPNAAKSSARCPALLAAYRRSLRPRSGRNSAESPWSPSSNRRRHTGFCRKVAFRARRSARSWAQ